MSERCTNNTELGLYSKDYSRPITLFNVEVLCIWCVNELNCDQPMDELSSILNEEDMISAYRIAGNRCQCDRIRCHRKLA
ncbi:MAG: hypothetical protein MK105_12235 [Crocinitomicaceae bacterium]|nr:hypothetical protein [Crocinitomicaceae bacterium]